MNANEYDTMQKSVSQRTDIADEFLVEYWRLKNEASGHYGYYIKQIDSDNYIVLEEGENINITCLYDLNADINKKGNQ